MQPISEARRLLAGRSRGPCPRAFRSKYRRQIDQQQIHRAALEQRPGDGQALVQGLRRQDDEPLQPDAAGHCLHRVEAPGEIQVRHDRAAGLRFCRETQSERGLAARGIAVDRNAGQPGHAARPEDRVQGGKSGGDDAAVIEVGRPLRRPIVERARRGLERARSELGFWLERILKRHGREGTDRGRRRCFSRKPRSCRTPASPKVRESDGDLG